MDTSETHRNATMSLLLPGRVLHLNALLVMRKFRDRGNKAGAVRGFEKLQQHNLGTIIWTKPERGTSMVRFTCKYCFQHWCNYNTHNNYCINLQMFQFEKGATPEDTTEKTAFADQLMRFGMSIMKKHAPWLRSQCSCTS